MKWPKPREKGCETPRQLAKCLIWALKIESRNDRPYINGEQYRTWAMGDEITRWYAVWRNSFRRNGRYTHEVFTAAAVKKEAVQMVREIRAGTRHYMDGCPPEDPFNEIS